MFNITRDTLGKLHNLGAAVRTCRYDVVAKAKLDNPTAGAEIERILEEHSKKAYKLMDVCSTLSTLSTQGLAGIRTKFITILADAKTAVAPYLERLSPETRKSIRESFREDLVEWKRQANEIYGVFGLEINSFPAIEGAIGMIEWGERGSKIGCGTTDGVTY